MKRSWKDDPFLKFEVYQDDDRWCAKVVNSIAEADYAYEASVDADNPREAIFNLIVELDLMEAEND